MPKLIRRATMNKIKGYLESLGIQSSSTTSQQAPAAAKLDELGCEDTLDAASFSFCKASIFGFPHEPSCFAYDPVQKVFAIGTKSGRVRVFGQPGAEQCLVHPSYTAEASSSSLEGSAASQQTTSAGVVQMLFVINEGGLITVCSDSKLHYWNIREKKPFIKNSIQFQREMPSYCFHAVQSKWLFVGTSQGNIHFVNIESFSLSGYIIYWNKAVGLTMCTKHPGAVVQLLDNPADPNKLLIGYESGLVVLWDLKSKNSDCRFAVQEGLHSFSWHSDGRYFMSSHTDGSLVTWDIKNNSKPASVEQPHAISKQAPGTKDYFMPIPKVEWKTAPESEQFVLFSGGTPISRGSRAPSTLSIMRGKNLNLLDLQSEIIDFCTLCSSPYPNDIQSPLAVAVLLENDLIIFDLQSGGYPPFENPYSMDIHDSEVTYNGFVVDVAPDIVPCLYKAGMRQRQNAFSPKEWPMKGGIPGQSLCSYYQLIITGHRNGLVKFWDASGIQLQILYLLNVSKLFQASDSKRRLNRANSSVRPGSQVVSPEGLPPVPDAADSTKPEAAGDAQQVPAAAQPAEAPTPTTNNNEPFVEVVKEEVSTPTSCQPEQSGGLGALINTGTFAIHKVKLSDNGQLLLVGGVGFAVLYRLNEQQAETSLSVVEARFSYQQTSPHPSVSSMGTTPAEAESGQTTPRPSNTASTTATPCGPQLLKMRQLSSPPPSSPPPNPSTFALPPNANSKRALGTRAVSCGGHLFRGPPPRRSTILSPPEDANPAFPGCVLLFHPTPENAVGCYLRQGNRRWNSGYQPDLAVVLGWMAPSTGSPADMPLQPPAVTCLDLQQSCEVIFVGTSCGVVVIDCVQKACVMKLTTPELYACIDPSTLKGVLKKALKEQRAAAAAEGGSDDEGEFTQSLNIGKTGNQVAASSSSCNSQSVISPMSPAPASALDGSSVTASSTSSNNSNDPKQGKVKSKGSTLKAVFRMVRSNKSDTSPARGEANASDVGDGGANKPLTSSTSAPHSKFHMPLATSPLSSNSFSVGCAAVAECDAASHADHASDSSQTRAARSGKPVVHRSLSSATDHLRLAGGGHAAASGPRTPVGVTPLLASPVAESVADSAISTAASGRDSPEIFTSPASNSTLTLQQQQQQQLSADTITCAVFADSYPNKVKPDTKQPQAMQAVPTLWIGSQSGAVFIAAISLPPDQADRSSSPVIVSISQTVYQLSGPVLTVDILPMADFISTKPHAVVPPPEQPVQQPKLKSKQSAPGGGLPVFQGAAAAVLDSATLQQQNAACQLGVMISRDQLVTILLPAQTVASRARPSAPGDGETRRQLVRAAIIRPKERHSTHCVACLASDGHISFFSLPRLRPLFELDQFCDGAVMPRYLNTFRFSHYGHAVFFNSPSEISKLSFWADTNDKIEVTQGSVFVEQPFPERPKQSFLKTLFNTSPGTTAMSERDELFGDPNLKPSVNVARNLGPPVNRLQQLQAEVSSATSSANSPYSRMIQGATERGEKLGDLEEKSQRMMLGASDFAKNAAALVDREKGKKWYNPFS